MQSNPSSTQNASQEALIALVQDLREFRYRLESVIPFEEAQWFTQRGEALSAALQRLVSMPSPPGHDKSCADASTSSITSPIQDEIVNQKNSMDSVCAALGLDAQASHEEVTQTIATLRNLAAARSATIERENFKPSSECDSPGLCEVNRSCAGRYGSKQICTKQVASGADSAGGNFSFARADAIVWPKSRNIARLEDMSADGYLRVMLDGDNDVCVEVYNQASGRFSSVQFCNPGGGGGGQSRHTRLALINVMVAMEKDNAQSARKAHPRFGAPQDKER